VNRESGNRLFFPVLSRQGVASTNLTDVRHPFQIKALVLPGKRSEARGQRAEDRGRRSEDGRQTVLSDLQIPNLRILKF